MRKQFHPWFRVLAVAVLMATLMLSGCSVSSQSPIQTSSIADKVPNEGVIVHGHWIIEVKNPDGTLIERREFDNALMSDGRELLVKLLARQTSLGGWIIRLMGAPTTGGAFMNESGVRTSGGIIVESTYTGTGPHIFKNMTISTPTTGDYAGRLVLSGTATAQVNGNIGTVQTENIGHAVTEVSSATYTGATIHSYTFSSSGISPVTLVAGQQVVVTVAINFS